MKEFNKCSHLVTNQEDINFINNKLEELKHTGISPLTYMLQMQDSLQKTLHEKYNRTPIPSQMQYTATKGELSDYIMEQQYAINDEFSELIHSIAGTSKDSKTASAIWKKWKSEYENIRNEHNTLDLTDEELLERQFEMVDIMHFIFVCLLALGIDSDEKLFTLYALKNKENLTRYNNNY